MVEVDGSAGRTGVVLLVLLVAKLDLAGDEGSNDVCAAGAGAGLLVMKVDSTRDEGSAYVCAGAGRCSTC